VLGTKLYRNTDWSLVFRSALLLLALLGIAVFFGLAAAVLPPFFVIAFTMIPLFVAITFVNMELALLVSVAAICGVIPAFLLPQLPVGGVIVRPGELLLMMLTALVYLKTLFRPTPFATILSPLKRPMLLLGVMYVISITYSVVIKKDAFGLAETRNLVGWFALPVAAYAFHWHFRRLDTYLHGFAIVVALLLVAQTVTGVQLIFAQRGAELISQEFSDVIRSSAGAANFLIGYSLYYALGRAATARGKILWIGLVILLGSGLIATFTRGAWAAAFVGLLVFFALTRVHRLIPGVLVVLVLLASLLATGLMVAKPHLMGVVTERILSIKEEGGVGTSVGARFDENEQALKAIKRNPLLGVGIGGDYKTHTSTRGRAIEAGEFMYIHNSYLGFAVKFGLLAMFVPFWIYRNLWREWKRHKPRLHANVQGVRLNMAAAFSAVSMFMVNALTQPEWLRLGGLVTLSLLIAIILSASAKIDIEKRAEAVGK
jgi:O-antigen ligase